MAILAPLEVEYRLPAAEPDDEPDHERHEPADRERPAQPHHLGSRAHRQGARGRPAAKDQAIEAHHPGPHFGLHGELYQGLGADPTDHHGEAGNPHRDEGEGVIGGGGESDHRQDQQAHGEQADLPQTLPSTATREPETAQNRTGADRGGEGGEGIRAPSEDRVGEAR